MTAKPTGSMNGPAISRWLRRQYDFLASRRLAVVLLAVLATLLVAYLLIPQLDPTDAELIRRWDETRGVIGKMARALGLTDVQHSWLLFSTYVLLFVNLVLCMIRRFRAVVRLYRFPENPPAVSPIWLHREVNGTDLDVGVGAAAIRRRGYRTLVVDNIIYGLRGRFAILGHWVFHLSFLVLIVGGMWVALAPETFRGTVGIGEGEPFNLLTAPFLGKNISPSQDLPELRFKMEKIKVLTEGEEVRRFEARLSNPEGKQVAVGINRPYRQNPYQVLVTNFGYMPGWVMVNERGRMLGGAWIKLAPFPHLVEDSFPIGPEESTVTVRFFPDYDGDGLVERSRSYELRNPKFDTRIVWRGKQVFEGLLEPGQRVELGQGRKFFFVPEIRKYTMLDVIQERGHEIILTGLCIMVLGILLRYARIRKEILVRVEGGSLQLFGRSEILKNLFAEELDRLAAELAEAGPPSQSRKGMA
jgi:cytochrome c biogenesis protein ResB